MPDFGLVFCFIGLHYRRTCVNRGSKASRSASPRRLKLIKAKKMKSPGKKTCSGAMKMLVAALVNRISPAWRRRLDAESQKTQRRFRPDGRTGIQSRGDDERREEFGNK